MSIQTPKYTFPKDFAWGVATSSFQIEGATHEDGRGPSIWDTFCAQEGAIADRSNGDVACDHYHRWSADLDLIKSLGVNAYRFSVAWPRIMPSGAGHVEARGLDFYDRLVDGLLERDIAPWVTLYHWDLPQALQDQGGWASREVVDHFVEYARVVCERLGDRVAGWITHNEPWCASVLGHLNGEHAPGLKDNYAHLASSHHIMLSHGRAVPVIRELIGDKPLGITLNLVPSVPASESAADHEAHERFDGFFNRWYLDPLVGRGYPDDMLKRYRDESYIDDWSFIKAGDLDAIAAPIDFLGINYYSRGIIRSDRVSESDNSPVTVSAIGEPTDMGWEVYPQGLYDLLTRVSAEYPFPSIHVTENGAAYATGPDADGVVRDTRRESYLRDHLIACNRARAAGVPLDGYFAWSLLDNFEWAFGYEKRFGLVYVDYETQQRIPKQSALWYRDVARSGVISGVDSGVIS